ncbi:PepSY-associated TM helix domain-containing protein [Vogesella oryzae]|uniref:PepSY-associated TM helix domain-containing protein n=1 Tax=Vogesella oryzae TaxID=1735285 RepID=UPI0015816CC8|nr:PepSY domain-containing protein [Vogesella oryzae]
MANAATAGKTPRFYTVAWRWHFYAGLIITPIMLLLAITGSIYLFKPQLDNLLYRQLLTVPASSAPAHPADHLLMVVKERYPQASVLRYLPPATPQRSAKVIVRDHGEKIGVYLDPYRASVLGTLSEEYSLQPLALKLHGELLAGKWGDRAVELATGWALVLLVSGLYLWWPRGRGKLAVFWPRWQAGGRAFWRDLHAVTGFWSALLLLFMLLSGMAWTGYWGDQFAAVWSRFPAQMWDQVPKSDKLALSLNSTEDKVIPWALEHSPLPKSDPHAAHHGALPQQATPRVSLQQVVDTANARGVVPGYAVVMPDGDEGVYTVSVFPDDARDEATLHIDQYSGKVLADIRYRDYGVVPKAVEMGIVLHEGRLFGLANQLLMLGICLLRILSCVSGLIMWWRRKPQGRLGAPDSPPDTPLWRGALLIMLLLGAAFPLVGLSFVAILLLDWALLRRLPVLAWLR